MICGEDGDRSEVTDLMDSVPKAVKPGVERPWANESFDLAIHRGSLRGLQELPSTSNTFYVAIHFQSCRTDTLFHEVSVSYLAIRSLPPRLARQ